MRLNDVMDEVALVLAQITGLRVWEYPPESLTPPAGYVSYPRIIMYDQTYGRGCDEMNDFAIVLVVSSVTTKHARDEVAKWSAGDGPTSLKRAMEAHEWTTCDDITVNSCEFDTEKIGGVTYLTALFKATVIGPGKEE